MGKTKQVKQKRYCTATRMYCMSGHCGSPIEGDGKFCAQCTEDQKKTTIDDLDDRQTATVLHALRLYQETVLYGNAHTPDGMCNSRKGCDHFDGVKPLTAEEIDALCERLNYGVEVKRG